MKSVRLAVILPFLLAATPSNSFAQVAKDLKPASENVSTSGVIMGPRGAQFSEREPSVQRSEEQILFDLKNGKPITPREVDLLTESFRARSAVLSTNSISSSSNLVKERMKTEKDPDVIAALDRLNDALTGMLLTRTAVPTRTQVEASAEEQRKGLVIPTEDTSIKHYTASMFDPNPVARLLQAGGGIVVNTTSDKLIGKYFTSADQTTKEMPQDALLFTALVLKFQNGMDFNKADNEALSRIWGTIRPIVENDKLKDAKLSLKIGKINQTQYDALAVNVKKELDAINSLIRSGDTKGALAAIQNGNYTDDLSNFRNIIKDSNYRILTGRYYVYGSTGYGVRIPLYNSSALQEAQAGVLRKLAFALDLYAYVGLSVLGQEAIVKKSGDDMDQATKKLLTTILTSGRVGPSMSLIYEGQELMTLKLGLEGNYMWVKEIGNNVDLSAFTNLTVRVPIYDIKNHQMFLYGTGDLTYTLAREGADKTLNVRGAVGAGVEVLEHAMVYLGTTGRLGINNNYEPGLEAGFKVKISRTLNFGLSAGIDDLGKGKRNSVTWSIDFSSRF